MPKISYLLQTLGPEPAVQQEQEENFPFLLVDPSLLDEPVSDTPPDAFSDMNREARQQEQTDLPVDKPYIEEGVEELLTPPDGSAGPAESSMPAPEQAPSESEATPEETSPPEAPEELQEETPPEETPPEEISEEPIELPEPPPPDTPEVAPLEELAPLPEFTPPPILQPEPPPPPEEIPEPIPDPLPEPPPEPVEQWVPPPPPEEVFEPQSIPEQQPDPQPEPPPEPLPVFEPVPEPPPPEPEPQPDPVADMVDIASLPVSPDGYFDPQTRYLEELARQAQSVPQPMPQWRQQPQEEYQPYPQTQQIQPPQPQEFYQPQPVPQAYQQPPQQQYQEPQQQPARRERRDRTGRPQPQFKKIGPNAPSTPSQPSQAGGSPRRVNRSSSVSMFSDPNMKILEHRYGRYMRELAKQLQESLNREVILSLANYVTGEAKIHFSINPNGSLSYYDTEYPFEEHKVYVRITSERTLVNAAPFEPPSQEMLNDPLFRKMSLTVFLY